VADLGYGGRTKLGDCRSWLQRPNGARRWPAAIGRSSGAWAAAGDEAQGAGSGSGGSQGRRLRAVMWELAGTSSRNSPRKAHGLPLFGDGGARAAGLSLS
jgi:hypothetical protein